MTPEHSTLPELLAPAGSPACALAAFDAGADAIYAGLAKFNARERGENFTPDSMGRIIDFAHKKGRKVYVTFNTLVREGELAEVAEQLALLENLGPDALLVQDFGVLRIAREYFPKLVLHASTQMGFHNSAGLALAEKLGVTRVVLERQMTLDEIAAVAGKTKLELEVFIHGALCASLSGQCLLSSSLGGMSGNRGQCKQPCRRRYFSNQGNGFFLSPQDLCAAEMIPELVRLGVASLKIEGRLKQPDYVANTVSAYRLLLDSASMQGADPEKVMGEARNLLSKGCGRRWSLGFFRRDAMKTLIQHDSLGAAGQLCGTVREIRENGFGFTTNKRLFLGDRLRVQPKSGEEGPAFTLTRLFVNGAPSRKALPGDEVTVPCDKEVPFGGLVFKIGQSFTDYTKALAALPARRAKLDLEISLDEKEFRIAVKNAPGDPFVYPYAPAVAEKSFLTLEKVTEEFSASDSADFALGSVKAHFTEKWFVPASVLKQVRRAFWENVREKLTPAAVFDDSGIGLEKFRRAYLALPQNGRTAGLLTETVAMVPGGEAPSKRTGIRADGIFDFNKLTNEVILPSFCPEEKLSALRRAIDAARQAGIGRFRIEGAYALMLLDPATDVIVTSAPLPVCNSMAAAELARFGVARVQAHLEMEEKDMLSLRDHAPLPTEIYRYGRPVLLISRATLPVEGPFRDARANGFRAKADRRDGMTRIYPEKIVSLPHVDGMFDFYDLRSAHWHAKETTAFNFDLTWN